MARNNKKCICCNTTYKYCGTCNDDIMKPSWMSTFCSEACKELWKTATEYNVNMLSKSDAKEIIEALELKERSVYVDCVQKDLEVILGPEEVATPTSKKNQKSHEVVTKEEK